MNERFPIVSLSAPGTAFLKQNDVVLAGATGSRGPQLFTGQAVPDLPAGTFLGEDDCAAAFVVEGRCPLPGATPADPMRHGLVLRALTGVELAAGETQYAAQRPGIALAVVILSDKGAAGLRTDECAPIIRDRCAGVLDVCHAQTFVIPDDPARLKALLARLCLDERFDLVLTSGGTGVAPRDLTPEATAAVLDKRLPGYERAMTNASLAVTPHGAISRAVAGTLGRALVVNLPGSPKAVAENLAPLLPTITHTIKKLQGDPEDCAGLRA